MSGLLLSPSSLKSVFSALERVWANCLNTFTFWILRHCMSFFSFLYCLNFFSLKCTDSNYFTTLRYCDHLAIDLFQDSRCDFTGQCGTRARQIGKFILLCRVNIYLHSLAYAPIYVSAGACPLNGNIKFRGEFHFWAHTCRLITDR